MGLKRTVADCAWVPLVSHLDANNLIRRINSSLKMSVLDAVHNFREKILEDLSSNVSDDLLASDETSLIIAATIYMYLAMPEKALRVLHRGSTLFW
nr:unnamed protein product [Spirometra erinaceieuropaei]